MELVYDYPLYRPPSEANSMIFQVTLGCSFNRCSFCNMYRTKQYVERPWDEIRLEIDLASNAYPSTTRVFLADGDALNLPTSTLTKILNRLYSKFTNLKRVSCYAMPRNLLQKKDSELYELRQAGLGMLYVGIESGSDIILKKVTKGATNRGILESCHKAKRYDYILSCMIILGLGGRTYTKQHICDTGKLVNKISPDYLAALSLHLDGYVYNEFMEKFNETFFPLNDYEVLDELERLITILNPTTPIIFRANHASNVYSLGGTIPQDKERLVSLVKELKCHPELLKPAVLRRF
jgi:radical SAM superfamily enzyme YgiQ (UPF0313 family)